MPFIKRTYMGQQWLIEPMKSLGYCSSTDGICAGITQMAIQAFLVGELPVFTKRLHLLYQFHKKGNLVKQVNKVKQKLALRKQKQLKTEIDSKNQEIIDILAFFDGIECYQNPEYYPAWLGARYSQLAIEKIAKTIAPNRIHQNHTEKNTESPICQIDSWPGIYTEDELLKYLQGLTEIAQKHKQNIAFTLMGATHRIGLCYDQKTKNWIFIGPNYLPPKIIQTNKLSRLAKKIHAEFSRQGNIFAFETIVHTTSSEKNAVSAFVTDLKQNAHFIASHEITPQKASARTKQNISLAYIAAKHGHTDILSLLAEQGTNFEEAEKDDGWSTAHIAAQNGQVEVLRFLAEQGVNLNPTDNDGWTPAHTAAKNGQVEVLRFLAEQGVNLNPTDNDGWTPAHVAAKNGQVEVLRLLAEQGINLNPTDNNGWTPAHTAAKNGRVEVLRFLTEKGVNLNPTDNDGWTPAHFAAKNGRVEVLRFLAKQGIDLTPPVKANGKTLYQIAKDNNQKNVMAFLQEQQSDRNTISKKMKFFFWQSPRSAPTKHKNALETQASLPPLVNI